MPSKTEDEKVGHIIMNNTIKLTSLISWLKVGVAYEQLKPRAPLLRPPLWQLEIDETSALSCWLAIAQQWLPWGYLSVLSFASEVPK